MRIMQVTTVMIVVHDRLVLVTPSASAACRAARRSTCSSDNDSLGWL